MRDYCNKEREGEGQSFQNSFDKQVLLSYIDIEERIATPRKDHRHSKRRARATSGLRVSGMVIGNL